MAVVYLEMGDLSAAAAASSEAVSILRGSRVGDHYEIATARIANALVLIRTGKAGLAETEIREAISVYRKVFPSEHRLLAAAHSTLGECLLAQGKLAEAEALLVSSARQLESTPHYDRRLALRRVIRLYEAKGNAASAKQFKDELAAFERKIRSQ